MTTGQIMVIAFNIFIALTYIGYAIKVNLKVLNIMFSDMSTITKSKFKNYGTANTNSNNIHRFNS